MKHSLLLLILLLMGACKNDAKKPTGEGLGGDKPATETKIPMEKTTYYFIRHAEKNRTDPGNPDPHLTKEGLQRAAFWAEFFEDKSLDMIYSTDYARTIQTVIPLLDVTGLKLRFYEPHRLYSEEFLKKTRGKTVLIVGHQITLPEMMNKLIGQDRYQKIPVDTYGNLYRIIFHKEGNITTSVSQPE